MTECIEMEKKQIRAGAQPECGELAGNGSKGGQKGNKEEAKVFYLSKLDADRHGYTKGCGGCSSFSRGFGKQPHTPACRERIMIAMEKEAGISFWPGLMRKPDVGETQMDRQIEFSTKWVYVDKNKEADDLTRDSFKIEGVRQQVGKEECDVALGEGVGDKVCAPAGVGNLLSGHGGEHRVEAGSSSQSSVAPSSFEAKVYGRIFKSAFMYKGPEAGLEMEVEEQSESAAVRVYSDACWPKT